MTPKEAVFAVMFPPYETSPVAHTWAESHVKKLDALGFAIVPKIPTEKMVEAGLNACIPSDDIDAAGSLDELEYLQLMIRLTAALKAAGETV